jgi:hypothetical protein
MDRVRPVRRGVIGSTEGHFVAIRTRILAITLVTPMALLLVALFVGGMVGSSSSRASLVVVGVPFIIAIVALLIRFAYAFDVSVEESQLAYRTAFRTRRFRKQEINHVSLVEVGNGFRTFCVPRLTLETGKSIDLRPFNCSKPKDERGPNPKAFRELSEMASALQQWAQGSDNQAR